MATAVMTLSEILEHIIDLSKMPNNRESINLALEEFVSREEIASSSEINTAIKMLEDDTNAFPARGFNQVNIAERLRETFNH